MSGSGATCFACSGVMTSCAKPRKSCFAHPEWWQLRALEMKSEEAVRLVGEPVPAGS
jgi:hypothetical protein